MLNFYCPHTESWVWAAQWMNGTNFPATFSFLGSHYRGYPLVKMCSVCKRKLQTGQPIIALSKGEPYCLVPRGEAPLARPLAQESQP